LWVAENILILHRQTKKDAFMKKYIVSLAVVLTASLFVSKANAATKEQPIKIAPLAVTNSNVASSLDKPIIIIKDDGTIIIIK